jgi:ABC-type uncharacterized transport system auxiliary subunit
MRIFYVLLISLFIVGCSSDPAPKDVYYRVEAVDIKALEAPVLKGLVEVARFTSDVVNDERGLLYRKDTESPEIRQYTYHRWADSPTRMLQHAMIRALRVSHATTDDVISPDVNAKPKWEISGRLYHIEEVLEGDHRVVIDMDINLRNMKKRKNVLIKNYRAEVPVSGTTLDEVTDGYNKAFAMIVDWFFEDIAAL